MSAAERGEWVVAHHQRIGPGSKNSTIIYPSAVYSAIVEKQKNESIDSCEFLNFGVALADQLSHFLTFLRHFRNLRPFRKWIKSRPPSIKVALITKGSWEVISCCNSDDLIILKMLLGYPNRHSCLWSTQNSQSLSIPPRIHSSFWSQS